MLETPQLENNNKTKNLVFFVLIFLNFIALFVIIYIIKNDSVKSQLQRNDFNLKLGESTMIYEVDDTSMYTFESDDKNIVIVDSKGVVTAINPGVTMVRVKDENGNLLMLSSIEVIEDIKISLDKSNVKMQVGDILDLQVTVFPSSYNDNVIWTSNDTSIVKVDSGKVIALKEGTAIIKASIKDGIYVAKCNIVVTGQNVVIQEQEKTNIDLPDTDKSSTNEPNVEQSNDMPPVVEQQSKVSGIVLTTNKIEMKVKEQVTLEYSISPINATNKNVTWSSSNSNVAKVENGIVTALAPGTTKVTVKTKDGNFTATATITVKKSVRIHFIKQNDSGDVILLESNGHFAMIDTGYSDTVNSDITKKYLNKLNVTELDFLLITHNHIDHIQYAPRLMKNYFKKVGTLYIKTYLGNDNQYSEYQQKRYDDTIKAATEKNIPIKYMETLGDGYTIKFDEMTLKLYNTTQQMVEGKFYGKNENYNSVYQYITIGNTKTFLAADGFHYKTLDPAINAIGKIDLLKMPHHGYNSCGLTDNSINKLSPKNVIITNSYERLNGEYDCINKFSNIPLHYVNGNDVNESIIIDYSNGNINIIKN